MKNWLESLQSPYYEALIVLLSLAAGTLVAIVAFYLVKRAKKIYKIDENAIKGLRKPLFTVILLLSLGPALDYLQLHLSWLDRSRQVLLIFAGAWLLVQFVALGRSALINQFDITAGDNLKARKVFTQVRVFERVAIVLIVVIALGLALMTFESIRQIGISLLTSAGIAGIIVGLAAQKLIGNILAGLQIAITQPIRIDDVVIVEGEWGRIEEITLTYVVVNIWDKRRMIVPSTYFIEKPFENWTRTTSEILGTVFIHTDYRMPVDELRAELTSILSNTALWDGKVNVVQVTGCTQTTMEVRALVSAVNSGTAWDLRVLVREKLVEFLQKNYPEMLPRTRVEITDPKPR